MQTDIACQTAIEDIFVNVDHSDLLATTEHLDVTQSTKVVDTTSHIQGMEHSGKGTECVCARGLYLAHHVDENRAGLTYAKLKTAAGIARAQCAADLALGTSHCETGQMDRTIARHSNIAIGRYGELLALLRSTIDINKNLIASTKNIVLWGGNVHIRLETEQLVIENVATKHLEFSLAYFAIYMLVDVLLYLGILYVGLLLNLSLSRTRLTDNHLLTAALGALAHTRLDLTYSCISLGFHATLLNLLLILTAQATNLIDLDATLHQLCYNLGL